MCTSLNLFAKRNRKAGFNKGRNEGKNDNVNRIVKDKDWIFIKRNNSID